MSQHIPQNVKMIFQNMSIFGGIMDPSQWKPEVTIVDKNRVCQ